MTDLNNIRDRSQLFRWLQQRSPYEASCIACRVALRVLPQWMIGKKFAALRLGLVLSIGPGTEVTGAEIDTTIPMRQFRDEERQKIGAYLDKMGRKIRYWLP